MAFLTTALHVLLWALLISVLCVPVFFLLAMIASLVRRMKTGRQHAACSRGLFQLHKTTIYTGKRSIKSRMAAELKSNGNRAAAQPAAPAPAQAPAKPLAVLRFDGDIYASGRVQFARLVDELVVNKDRVAGAVVVVSSPGGGVAQYGQLYAEMERLRKAGIPLTVCVDTYAASGGYLMSVPANKIVAAPFATVGSIGVVSEFVNAHGFLKQLGFEPLTLTAGKYKRTVTPMGEITDEGKAHFQEQLNAIHRLFIAAVQKYRKVDPDKVCTGDHWTAQESVEQNLNLVDELATSQEYLLQANQENDLVFFSERRNPFERGIFRFLTRLSDHILERLTSIFMGGMKA